MIYGEVSRVVDEERVITLKTLLEQEEHNRDLFNLEVDKYRLIHGMSVSLTQLYIDMGRLSRKLVVLEGEIASIKLSWRSLTHSFQIMKDRER